MKKGINVLRAGKNSSEALHSLVINQLLLFGGKAVWLDTGNMCSTHLFSRLTPSTSILDRVDVARAFTPYQHYSLSEKVSEIADRDTELLVVPLANHLYDEMRNNEEGREMLFEAMKNIEKVGKKNSLAVLLTESDQTDLKLPLRDPSVIECRRTDMGIRFRTDSFKTLTYTGPGYIQTTLMLWELLLKQTLQQTKTRKVIEHRKNQPNVQKRIKTA